jgi:hypothetical protein
MRLKCVPGHDGEQQRAMGRQRADTSQDADAEHGEHAEATAVRRTRTR